MSLRVRTLTDDDAYVANVGRPIANKCSFFGNIKRSMMDQFDVKFFNYFG